MEPGDRIVSAIIGICVVFTVFIALIIIMQFAFAGNGASSRIVLVTPFKVGDEITLNHWGGQDADKLSGFIITVNGVEQPVQLGITPGSHVTFPGTSSKDHIVVQGKFDNGRWFLLDTHVTETAQVKKQADFITITYIGDEKNVMGDFSFFINGINQKVKLATIPGSNVTMKGTFEKDHLVIQRVINRTITYETLESNKSVVVDMFV